MKSKSGRKRKHPGSLQASKRAKSDGKKKAFTRPLHNEEISSESEMSGHDKSEEEETKTGESAKIDELENRDESAQEKKIRLAKKYLQELAKQEAERLNVDDVDDSAVANRLKEDALEKLGKLQRKVADEYLQPESADIRTLRGHKLPVTCVVISPDKLHIFSGSKDCSLIKWDVETGMKVKKIARVSKEEEKSKNGHSAHVLALAISSDGKFLASGCAGKRILIWDPHTCNFLHKFEGHRDAISGLSFRKGTHQLFSASHDRAVKVWSLDEMSYVETLLGHQESIEGIDSMGMERCVTAGGKDHSVRVWKVVEASQLVFVGGPCGSIDCISLINEEHFISGTDDGWISLWFVMKKRPLVTLKDAHKDAPDNSSNGPMWISSVAALQNTDLVASGSRDGFIRLWKCGDGFRTLTPVFSIPVAGFVNSIQFSPDGSFLVAGIGQEHRLGRWWRKKESKNSIAIIRLKRK